MVLGPRDQAGHVHPHGRARPLALLFFVGVAAGLGGEVGGERVHVTPQGLDDERPGESPVVYKVHAASRIRSAYAGGSAPCSVLSTTTWRASTVSGTRALVCHHNAVRARSTAIGSMSPP